MWSVGHMEDQLSTSLFAASLATVSEGAALLEARQDGLLFLPRENNLLLGCRWLLVSAVVFVIGIGGQRVDNDA